jgi:aminoglycoside phosphotransferase (APT) family kinase protein
VAREYKVLTALSHTAVRVPNTVLMCEDESVIGAPFYLMELVQGVVIRDPGDLPWSDGFEAVGRELVDALVELHAVDVDACGLTDFGKRAGYLERQLRRWTGQLELTLPFTRPVPDLERVGEWLKDNRPGSGSATLVHGDYKLDNAMFERSRRPRLTAILDWEMSTIGDPLADLGWMISFWREPAEAGDDDVLVELGAVTAMSGFSSRSELVARYSAATGREIEGLDWYEVLAIWKLAILLEGSYARHLAGATDDPFFAEMEHAVPALARRALGIAQRS